MGSPALAPAPTIPAQRFSALLRLIALLLGALTAAALATTYLLRTAVVPVTHIAAAPAPAPYRVLYLRGGQIWSVRPDGRQEQVTHIPATIGGQVRRAVLAPDGQHLVLIAASGATERAWLLDGPDATPRPLLDPGQSAGVGGRHYVDAVWPGSLRLTLLVSQGTRSWLARYALTGPTPTRAAAWIALPDRGAQPLSLSPDGREVALALTQPGTGAFASQIAVRLLSVGGRHASTAYRYLGTAAPSAVAWAPDRGTVAIASAAEGLAVQKSSGRPVLEVTNGALPVAFSRGNAQLAYVAGQPGAWEIHVLALHSERDRTVISGLQTAPSSLYWTPDARALLYLTGASLWQADPSTGMAQLVAATVPGTPVQLVAAMGPFAG